MATGINKSKTLRKPISCNCRCKLDSRKRYSKKKWNNNKFQGKCRKPIKHRICKEEYAWNPSTCTCEYDEDFEID